MKTRNRLLLGFGSIERKSREVALAAVVVCCAIVIHGVLIVMPSNSNATLADASNGKDITVRLGQHSEPHLLDQFSREILQTIDRHETALALITETAETPKPISTDAESAKSSDAPRQEAPPPLPSKPSKPGRTAVAEADSAGTNLEVGKTSISALPVRAEGAAYPVAISALSDQDIDAASALPPLAISATAQ
jgi:hypothetical protein